MQKTTKIKNGFTLVELLIVVAIIAVLTGMLVVVINPKKAQSKARDGQRIQDIKAIQSALEVYFAERGRYPSSGSIACNTGVWEHLQATPAAPNGSSCLRTTLRAGAAPYLRGDTNDPTTSSAPATASPCGASPGLGYRYISDSTVGTSQYQRYILVAILENVNVYSGTGCNNTSLSNWGVLPASSCASVPNTCYAVQNN